VKRVAFLALVLVLGGCAARMTVFSPQVTTRTLEAEMDQLWSSLASGLSCVDTCRVSDRICEAAKKICEITAENPGDAGLARSCARASERCQAAQQQCAACRRP
jgi:hypothetical protein